MYKKHDICKLNSALYDNTIRLFQETIFYQIVKIGKYCFLFVILEQFLEQLHNNFYNNQNFNSIKITMIH